MDQITDDALKELEAKHGEVAVFTDRYAPPRWQLVLRLPTESEIAAFRMQLHNPGRVAHAQADIVRATAVWPEKDEVRALLAKRGLVAEGVCKSDTWQTFVGLEVNENAKK